MKNKQTGFTILELAVVVVGVIAVAATCTTVYIAIHFISKFW